jgi:hypothetical protein
VLDPNLVKGNWTFEEDEKIMAWVEAHGTKSWSQLAATMPGRIGKQTRERYHNAIKPGLGNHEWTQSEDDLVIGLQLTWGNKWERIADFLPDRSANSIKNRWNSVLKNYCSGGLVHVKPDPDTANPRLFSPDQMDVPFDP